MEKRYLKSFLFPDNYQFNFETLRAMGAAVYGGAEIGEVISIAERIVSGDYDSWHDEWYKVATRLDAEARDCAEKGYMISARDAWLRASNYYRNAEFFLHANPDDERIKRSYFKQVECFRKAAPYFPVPCTPVEIPFEDKVLHGYWYTTCPEGETRPTMLVQTGYDGSAEEQHFFGAAAGAERGYNVLSFDGPGQPAAIHRYGMTFRPDWENVVKAVVDWTEKQKGVDPKKIGLLGESMGGVLAPHAAAYEHRLAACVALDGIYDMGEVFCGLLGTKDRDEAYALLLDESNHEVDARLNAAREKSVVVKWASEHSTLVLNTPTTRKFLAKYFEFNCRNIAQNIQCPTLICDSDDDGTFKGQAMRLYNLLTCPKEYMLFTTEEGAGDHCHVLGLRLNLARVYDWLDKTFQYRAKF